MMSEYMLKVKLETAKRSNVCLKTVGVRDSVPQEILNINWERWRKKVIYMLFLYHGMLG